MGLEDRFDQILLAVLMVVMGLTAALNWLNRAHGGFARGWAGAIFIAVCWSMSIIFILLKLRA